MDVKLPDGTVIKGVPDGMSKADLTAKLASNGYDISKLQSTPIADQENQHSALANLGQGALSGAANIGATLLSPIDWALQKAGVESPDYNRRQKLEQFFKEHSNPESAAFKTGEIGTEIAGTAGLGGAIAAPVRALGAGRLATAIESAGFKAGEPAQTIAGKVANAGLRAAGGAIAGGAASGMVNPENAGTGAALGAGFGTIAAPILSKAIGSVVSKFNPANPASATLAADEAIKKVAEDTGVKVTDISPETVRIIRDETAKAFSQGKSIDPAALLRQKEFEKLGMRPLQGQITRDPNQYAQEINLRGVSPAISGRLQEQNKILQQVFSNPAQGASESYQAGNQLADVLRNYNKTKQGEVSALYAQARESVGKDLEVPLQGLSQDFADISKRYSGEVPEGLLNQFRDYGIAGGKQTKLYTVEEADTLLKAINRHAQGASGGKAAALGELRDAVKNSVNEVDASGGVFAPAVKAAKQRFSELDAIPALKAVAEGNVTPDTFVSQFIVRGKTDQVKRLADTLRNQSPEAFGQAKAQMADDIKRAAFGENLDSNAAVSPERLAKKLRELGTEKMGAFFTPAEIENYQTAARVATYIAKHPNAAPVNTSNTLVAQLMNNPLINAAANVKGLGAAVAAGKAMTGAVKNQMAATQAMNAKVPMEKLKLDENQSRLLAKVLGNIGSGTSGAFAQ